VATYADVCYSGLGSDSFVPIPPMRTIWMRFTAAALPGLIIVDLSVMSDDRGYFARTFCAEEFAAAGLPTVFPQCNTSFNLARGTLRGLHWQANPYPEGKLVRCTRGMILDVTVDLRPESPTCRRWFGIELSAEDGRALYIPPGFAHGFQTLADETEVFYQMSESYRRDLSRGGRWDDPAFGIDWPIRNPILSPRDAAYPNYVA
jgi:dTDP-4-dehydrorhamnose 3,5-epimerase